MLLEGLAETAWKTAWKLQSGLLWGWKDQLSSAQRSRSQSQETLRTHSGFLPRSRQRC
jgi:hypothetical protein